MKFFFFISFHYRSSGTGQDPSLSAVGVVLVASTKLQVTVPGVTVMKQRYLDIGSSPFLITLVGGATRRSEDTFQR